MPSEGVSWLRRKGSHCIDSGTLFNLDAMTKCLRPMKQYGHTTSEIIITRVINSFYTLSQYDDTMIINKADFQCWNKLLGDNLGNNTTSKLIISI